MYRQYDVRATVAESPPCVQTICSKCAIAEARVEAETATQRIADKAASTMVGDTESARATTIKARDVHDDFIRLKAQLRDCAYACL